MQEHVGNVYEVKGLPVTTLRGTDLEIDGRWEVVEFETPDRGAGLTSECFTLVPEGAGEGWEERIVTCVPDDLLAQIDPERLARERTDEAALERAEAGEGA
jgi:hypothetical protein